MILQLPVCCHIPPLTKYTRFLCLLLISIITSEFLSHKAPGKIPLNYYSNIGRTQSQRDYALSFFEKRLTLNVTAECIRKSQAKFIGSLPLNHSPAQAVAPGCRGRSDCKQLGFNIHAVANILFCQGTIHTKRAAQNPENPS